MRLSVNSFSDKERQGTNCDFLMAICFCSKNTLSQDPLLWGSQMGIKAPVDKGSVKSAVKTSP